MKQKPTKFAGINYRACEPRTIFPKMVLRETADTSTLFANIKNLFGTFKKNKSHLKFFVSLGFEIYEIFVTFLGAKAPLGFACDSN